MRERTWLPPPQVSVQVLQGENSDQTLSPEIKKLRLSILIKIAIATDNKL